jgi:hypothetical protein
VAIAFDAFSEGGSVTGVSTSWTHTPVGTPRGVLVLIGQDVGVTHEVTAVTYGGVACAEVALSPLVKDAGTEDGVLYGYFLGASLPTGAQSVAVTVDGTGSEWRGVAVTVTAATNVSVEDTSTLNSASVANPTVTVDVTVECVVLGVLFSGQNAVTGIASGADYTQLAEHDYGGTVSGWQRRTTNPTSGAVTVDWVVGAEKAGVLAVALREAPAAGSVVPVLMPQYRTRGA